MNEDNKSNSWLKEPDHSDQPPNMGASFVNTGGGESNSWRSEDDTSTNVAPEKPLTRAEKAAQAREDDLQFFRMKEIALDSMLQKSQEQLKREQRATNRIDTTMGMPMEGIARRNAGSSDDSRSSGKGSGGRDSGGRRSY